MPPNEFDLLRREYKPPMVSLLLVGESRPSGGTFFCKGDSILYTHTQRAFAQVFGSRCGTNHSFLRFFQGSGCYLDDLCPEPVNHLSEQESLVKRMEGVTLLAERLRGEKPKVIVAVMKDAAPFIQTAVQQAALGNVPFESLPFPVRSERNINVFVAGLSRILREYITPPPARS